MCADVYVFVCVIVYTIIPGRNLSSIRFPDVGGSCAFRGWQLQAKPNRQSDKQHKRCWSDRNDLLSWLSLCLSKTNHGSSEVLRHMPYGSRKNILPTIHNYQDCLLSAVHSAASKGNAISNYIRDFYGNWINILISNQSLIIGLLVIVELWLFNKSRWELVRGKSDAHCWWTSLMSFMKYHFWIQ